MLRTYKGRYENGKIILPQHEQDKIPNNAEIIITVLTDDTRERTERLKKLLAKATEAENELTAGEWAEFENIRSQTDFDRGVEKWFTP